MTSYPFPFILIMELICLLFALKLVPRQKAGYFQYIKWLLLVTVIAEAVGYYFHVMLHKNNEWIYNIYVLPVEMFCIYTIMQNICADYFPLKKWNTIICGLFAVLYTWESISSHSLRYSSFTNSIFSGFVVLICCLYYYFLLKSDEIVSIISHPPFWIISGLFFFYFGSTACNLFYKYLASINLQQNKPLRYYIFIILNFIYYSCWSYAFICRKRQTISP